jgi:hypothetical protein
LGLAGQASAATFTYPNNNTFDHNAHDWESSEATCTAALLPGNPLCSAANNFDSSLGLPGGSLQSRYGTIVGAVGEVEAEAQTTWSSTFTYAEGAVHMAAFSYDRRAQLIPLINLGAAQSLVQLTDLTSGTTSVLVPPDDPKFTPLLPADAKFENVTVNVNPNLFVTGHQYKIEIRTFFRGLLSLLGGQQVNYDNVILTVDADPGPGGGTSTGPRGPRQVLPGAGGLGACTTDSREVPQPAKGRGNPGKVTLSAGQLLINQRISQAAVRRVNATIDRITKGLTGNDIRDCALSADDFNGGFVTALLGPEPAGPATAVGKPRPVPKRQQQARDPASVKLERTQLIISQRIAQAAVRRVNAATKRFNALTAGDFQLGTLDATPLATDMRRLLGGGAPTNAAGSTAFKPITTAPAGARNPGAVKLTKNQLLINQRISQAAVRRINHLQAQLASGITGKQIVDGSITRANLTPPVQTGQP